jgi:phosphate transport system substrate-binding protein
MKRTGIAALAMFAVAGVGCQKQESTPPASTQGEAKAPAQAEAPKAAPGTIKIDGSSTVFPIMEAVAEEFQKEKRDVRVTVGISGTGGGFKKFCAGETDISNASRPIKPTEVELCGKNGIEYVEIPIAYDGLAVMVNPKNNWAKSMTVAELKKLWEPEAQGKITRWNQIRPTWPNQEIHLFGAGVDSGTYDYFTEAIVGKEHSSRGDFTSSEDDNVLVQGIANDVNALGFFGYAYYSENKDKLKLVPVDDGKPDNGEGPITPSPETVRTGTYQPLSRPIFVYASVKALDRPEVMSLVKFATEQGPKLVPEVGYIPLPARAYELALKRAETKKTGSVFGGKGSQVGVSIEQLLEKEGPSTAAAPTTTPAPQ